MPYPTTAPCPACQRSVPIVAINSEQRQTLCPDHGARWEKK